MGGYKDRILGQLATLNGNTNTVWRWDWDERLQAMKKAEEKLKSESKMRKM